MGGLMELGWIDFSDSDREKVLGVLDLLNEPGVIDELGIASIRDAFSDKFFPGTSTIQTRAKYFFIVPYALKKLERSKKTDLKKEFNKIEKECAVKFLVDNPSEKGVIGKRSINNPKWIKRTPASIYWAGLQRYGIIDFNSLGDNKKLSVDSYINLISQQNSERTNNKTVGNNIDKIEGSSDDEYGLNSGTLNFIKIPFYDDDWCKNLKIALTPEEGKFLKKQIISTCQGSMFEYILSHEELWDKIIECKDFSCLKDELIVGFPEEIQKDYYNALYFSDFVFILRVIYNDIVSEGENDEAKKWLNMYNLKDIAKMVDIDYVMDTCDVKDDELKYFLVKCKELMVEEKRDAIEEEIKKREVDLKGEERSKTSYPGQFDDQDWFGGYTLNYRFYNAVQIIKDIHDSQSEVINNDES